MLKAQQGTLSLTYHTSQLPESALRSRISHSPSPVPSPLPRPSLSHLVLFLLGLSPVPFVFLGAGLVVQCEKKLVQVASERVHAHRGRKLGVLSLVADH